MIFPGELPSTPDIHGAELGAVSFEIGFGQKPWIKILLSFASEQRERIKYFAARSIFVASYYAFYRYSPLEQEVLRSGDGTSHFDIVLLLRQRGHKHNPEPRIFSCKKAVKTDPGNRSLSVRADKTFVVYQCHPKRLASAVLVWVFGGCRNFCAATPAFYCQRDAVK